MSKPRQNSLVDIPSATTLSGIPLNLQRAPKTSSTGSGDPRPTAASTSSCRGPSDDDDVFGLKSLSSRGGSTTSALSTPAAVATLVQIGENTRGSADDDRGSIQFNFNKLLNGLFSGLLLVHVHLSVSQSTSKTLLKIRLKLN